MSNDRPDDSASERVWRFCHRWMMRTNWAMLTIGSVLILLGVDSEWGMRTVVLALVSMKLFESER